MLIGEPLVKPWIEARPLLGWLAYLAIPLLLWIGFVKITAGWRREFARASPNSPLNCLPVQA